MRSFLINNLYDIKEETSMSKIIHKCKNCQSDLKSKNQKKFCSKSCAAKYNNKKRKPRSIESRTKTSKTIRRLIKNNVITVPSKPILYWGEHTKISRKNCTNCQKAFWATGYKRCCSPECKHARCAFNNVKKTHIKYWNEFDEEYIDLHSTWEVIIADWLTESNIKWSRPHKTLTWIDKNGKTYRYLPDFLIHEIKLYVDVKNPLKMKQDAEKIAILISEYNLIVGSIDETKSFINKFRLSTLDRT